MQNVRLILAAIVLLGAGAALGWFSASRFHVPVSTLESGKPAVYFRIDDPELLAAAPSWETWKYPGSKLENSSTGGGFASAGLEFGATERIALVTPDDFDKVWAFYKDKCQLRQPGDGSSNLRFEGSASNQSVTIKLFDDVQAHSFTGPKSDLLAARAFTVHSLRYQLVGFVYRPTGAESTCILLAYRPNKEFIGILKDRVVKW